MKTLRLLFLLACAVCAAGCSLRSGSGGTPAGTSTLGTSIDVRTESRSLAALLVTLGLMTYAAEDGSAAAPATGLDPRRSVSEQDCTRPLEDTGGNLRCR